MNVEKVLLAKPRGFCAGVEMAIKALNWMVKLFDPPIYCYHEIIHNKNVVERFESKGVIFVDDVSRVPLAAPLMLSAHGSAPEVKEVAQSRFSAVIDAACPLVTKVHHEIKTRAAKGYKIIYVGHPNHEETIGAMAEAPEATTLVMRVADVMSFDPPEGSNIALLAQTTLSLDEWRQIMDAARQKFPNLWMPSRSDLCYATTNRQGAVKKIAPLVDTFIIVGSSNSSNTLALAKVASQAGAKNILRVSSSHDLPDFLDGIIGLSAGASAPDEIIVEIINKLNPRSGVEEVTYTEEEEYFPPPRELRELVRSLSKALALGVGMVGEANVFENDRNFSGNDALAEIS